jgi:hypothetical protein
MEDSEKEQASARYRQLANLKDKARLIYAEIENSILTNQQKYAVYDYNNRHRIMKNDVIKAVTSNSEYQTIKRNIAQLESEDINLYFFTNRDY